MYSVRSQASVPTVIQEWLDSSVKAAEAATKPEELNTLFSFDAKKNHASANNEPLLEKVRRFLANCESYPNFYWDFHRVTDREMLIKNIDTFCKEVDRRVHEQKPCQEDERESHQDREYRQVQIAMQEVLKEAAQTDQWSGLVDIYRAGARAEFRDDNGNNLLMLACQTKNLTEAGKLEMVKMILRAHPLPTEAQLQISHSSQKDIAQQRNKQNKTALTIAKENGNKAIVDCITERAFSLNAAQQRAKAKQKNTA